MIPQAAITEWNQFVPWPNEVQVEQDLRIILRITNHFGNITKTSENAIIVFPLRTTFLYVNSCVLQRIIAGLIVFFSSIQSQSVYLYS